MYRGYNTSNISFKNLTNKAIIGLKNKWLITYYGIKYAKTHIQSMTKSINPLIR